jgi:hypothetical protein
MASFRLLFLKIKCSKRLLLITILTKTDKMVSALEKTYFSKNTKKKLKNNVLLNLMKDFQRKAD